MKKLKKIGIGVGATFGLLIVLIITLPFVIDVNRFKEPILKKVEENINGRVSLGKIGLKLFPFIGLRLEELSVQNLPDTPFGETPIVKLGELDFKIHLKSILKKKIVASLLLRAPEIQFLTAAQGSNIDLLIKKEAVPAAPPPAPEPSAEEKPAAAPAAPPKWIDEIVVEEIAIRDGMFLLQDQTKPGEPLKITGFRLQITNVVVTDTTQPIGIDLGMRLFDAKEENLAFEAKVAVDQEKKNAILEKGKLTVAGSPILINLTVQDYEKEKKVDAVLSAPGFAMNSIYSLLPKAKKGFPPGSSLEGSLSLNVTAKGTPESMNIDTTLDLKSAAIQYGETFVKASGSPMDFGLKVHYTPTNPQVSGTLSLAAFRSTKFNLTNVKSAFSYAGKVARLNDLGFDLMDGHFSGSGLFDMNNPKGSWDFNFKIEHLNMDSALTTLAELKDVLTGSGNLDLAIAGVGTETPEIKKSLSGKATFSLAKGELKVINMTSGIFSGDLLDGMNQVSKATSAVGLGDLSFAKPAAQNLKSTPYDELKGGFTIQEGKILLSDMTLNHTESSMQLGGNISLELDLDLTGRYFLSKQATEGWIGNPKLRTYLADPEGRFVVPFKIAGKVKSPVIYPDVSYTKDLVGKAVASYAKDEAKKQAVQAVKEKVVPQAQEAAKEQLQQVAPEAPAPSDVGKKLKKLF